MMMRANARVLPRGSSAQSDPSGALRCDRAAEDMLRAFWSEAAVGAALPVAFGWQLRGAPAATWLAAAGGGTGPDGCAAEGAAAAASSRAGR